MLTHLSQWQIKFNLGLICLSCLCLADKRLTDDTCFNAITQCFGNISVFYVWIKIVSHFAVSIDAFICPEVHSISKALTYAKRNEWPNPCYSPLGKVQAKDLCFLFLSKSFGVIFCYDQFCVLLIDDNSVKWPSFHQVHTLIRFIEDRIIFFCINLQLDIGTDVRFFCLF